MEELKTMLDNNMPVADINSLVNQFIVSANGHQDKIKLTFVALNLFQEGLKLLKTVDSNVFIKQVKDRIDEVEKQYKSVKEEYAVHLEQNDNIIGVLNDKNNCKITEIQKQIQNLLLYYDGIIKELVEARDKLPIEIQIVQEKK